jgi:hypothetical protein
MNNDYFWLLTLLILCVGFSIQPLRELWRKMRPSRNALQQNKTKALGASERVRTSESLGTSEPMHSSNQRDSILKKYNVPSSYLSYLSRLNNEELEDWARAFFAANTDRSWQ